MFNKKNLFLRIFYFLIIFFIFIYLSCFQSSLSILWFCKISIILLIIALISNSDILYSCVLISQSFVFLIFLLEVVSLFLFNVSLFNLSNIYNNFFDWIISIFYHVVIFLIPLHLLILKRKFIQDTWFLSSFLFLFFSVVIYVIDKFNLPIDGSINCVFSCNNFGIITYAYNLIYQYIPIANFIINWIILSFLFYITSLFFDKILNNK
ncbi:MAG: hypothetical protein PHR26_03840 [Candidatus ainarchaeum sp.]|nr:hypothetical protein [Candidatus ainarchaeum sp.]MDD3975867.1 hypothetical protein [Candidatus ainarchaeum sp.]